MFAQYYTPQLHSDISSNPQLINFLFGDLKEPGKTHTSKCSLSNNSKSKCNQTKDTSTTGKWPAVDILEYSYSYTILTSLPGFNKNEVNIDFDNSTNTITIQGQKITEDSILTQKREDAVVVEDVEVDVDVDDDDNHSVHSLHSDKSSTSIKSAISKISNISHTNQLKSKSNPILVLNERKVNYSFKRSFKLKESVDIDNIIAKFEYGLLDISLPKVAKSQNIRKLKIN